MVAFFVAFAIMGFVIPATVSAVSGSYYVWTDYKSFTKGNMATLLNCMG